MFREIPNPQKIVPKTPDHMGYVCICLYMTCVPFPNSTPGPVSSPCSRHLVNTKRASTEQINVHWLWIYTWSCSTALDKFQTTKIQPCCNQQLSCCLSHFSFAYIMI